MRRSCLVRSEAPSSLQSSRIVSGRCSRNAPPAARSRARQHLGDDLRDVVRIRAGQLRSWATSSVRVVVGWRLAGDRRCPSRHDGERTGKVGKDGYCRPEVALTGLDRARAAVQRHDAAGQVAPGHPSPAGRADPRGQRRPGPARPGSTRPGRRTRRGCWTPPRATAGSARIRYDR